MDKKVWYVTGASKGLGLALINRLLKAGHFVAATSAFSPGLTAAVEPNPRFLPLDADPADGQSMAEAFRSIDETFGRIDIIVNNAGYGLGVPVNHSINVIQKALPWLKTQRAGHIINIAPVTDVIGDTSVGRGFYTAARQATLGWSVTLAEEVRPFNIRVTTVLPEGFHIWSSAGKPSVQSSSQPSAQSSQGSSQLFPGSPQPSQGAQPSSSPQTWYCSIDGRQPGDPAKAAAALLSIATAAEPPALVYLTSDAHKKATVKMEWLGEAIASDLLRAAFVLS